MRESNVEMWRAVKGFEGYAVSDKGRVKSVERTVICKDGRKRHYKEKILKPVKDKKGYLYVNLSKNGVKKHHFVHRLVAEAFIPNPDPEKYDIVNHKDDIPNDHSNNCVDNLEWCDYEYNLNYGTHNERSAKTRTNHPDLSKTVYQFTKDTHELIKEWQSTMEVERQTGYFATAISACCNNCYNPKGSTHNVYKGFIWSYTHL